MKVQLIIGCLAMTSLMSGCGKLGSKRYQPPSSLIFSGIGGIEAPEERELNPIELASASLICSSLKTKRTALETQSGKIAYYFNLESRDCSDALLEKRQFNATILAVGKDLEYSSKEISVFHNDVVTDQTESIASICARVLDPTTPIDQKKISNATVVKNKFFIAAFIKKNNYDTVQITARVKDSNGAFSPAYAEEISIATNDTQLGAKFIGVEKERTKLTQCKGKAVSTLKETWINALTPL